MVGGKGGLGGLCENCSKAQTCALPTSWHEPVLECVHFAPKGAGEESVEKPTQKTSEPPRAPRGLCVTCENMPVCEFPWPEEGIWHCPNYR